MLDKSNALNPHKFSHWAKGEKKRKGKFRAGGLSLSFYEKIKLPLFDISQFF
jgi:hypothetical protein